MPGQHEYFAIFQQARSHCETDPFLHPNGIEAHGLLLVLEPDTLRIQQCSANACDWLGTPTEALQGQPLAHYLCDDDMAMLHPALHSGYQGPVPLSLRPPGHHPVKASGSYARLHQNAQGAILLELEPRLISLEQCPSLHQQLLNALERLNRCSDLQRFLDTAASEIRYLSGADQVAVFQFGIDDHGSVVAEERAAHMPSYLGLRFPGSDIPHQVRRHAIKHPMRMTPDVQAEMIPLCPSPQPLDHAGCHLRYVHPRARQYYQNMGVRAVLALSIVRNGQLWGYICALHPQPLLVDATVRQHCEIITANVSSQLSEREQTAEAHSRRYLQTLMEQMLHRLSNGASWRQVLTQEQKTLLRFMDAGGVAVKLADEWLLLGNTPELAAVQGLQQWLIERCETSFCTEQLTAVYAPAQTFSVQASGLLAMAMGDGAYWVLWFRPEFPRTVSWAGGPENDLLRDAHGQPILHPRNSFHAWAQLLRNTSQPFTPAQRGFAQEFCQWLQERLRVSQLILNDRPYPSTQTTAHLLHLTQDFLWRAYPQDLGIAYISPGVESITGHPPLNFLQQADLYQRLIHTTDRERVMRTLKTQPADQPFDLEYRIVHHNGEIRWLRHRGKVVPGDHGQGFMLEGIATDISRQKQLEQRLHHQANYDTLTGLPNRHLTLDRLAKLCQSQQRQGAHPFGVCFLDINRFKWINDSLGHDTGDQVLIHVAEQLRLSLRPGDTVGRLGGDEFVILLPELPAPDHAVAITRRIRSHLAQPLELAGQQLLLRVSIGIVAVDRQHWTPEQILAQADMAMYVAKRAGDLYRFFEPTMMAESEAHLELIDLVPKALETDQFDIYYQPMVQLQGHDVWGFEALLRWRHPQRGLIRPGEFLSIIEHLPIFQELGYYLLDRAAAQARHWNQHRQKPVSLHLNVSARQLHSEGFAQRLMHILQEQHCEPHWLCLEVTEDALLSNTPTALHCLQTLNGHGVRVFLDDFGMGYSSLSYLHRFPVSGVKIDHNLVANLHKNLRDNTIAQAIVAVAQALKLGVIAEGIEDRQTVERLRSMGCDLGQGYLFSEPLPSHQANTWLSPSQ